MFKIISRLLDANKAELTTIQPLVDKVKTFEEKFKTFKVADFAKETAEFKKRFSRGETLDDLLPEAYALAKEAAFRSIGERPYDVQVLAAIVLHQGKVAEQRTGEGKTLSASLPLYLNALEGKGVHLVTVNDYLARIGCGWMGPVYHLLGVSVSAIINGQSFIYDPGYEDQKAADWRLRFLKPVSRKQAYDADITYGINSEFGFDYLRDNMVSSLAQKSQRGHNFAIVDEVDSVLIDEARTPHIISAPDMEATKKYYDYAKMVEQLSAVSDFEIDEKMRTAHLTEAGITHVEKILNKPNLYEDDFQTIHHIEAALKAKTLFKKEKDYIVRNGEVVIVDEFTGRLLEGRRYSEGLHQAIEAKENVAIQQESKTLAAISLQNYFRMHKKLAGMTGTAATEAEEFRKIYNLDVIVVPTHKSLIRQDLSDLIYKTAAGKYQAVTHKIKEIHATGQPILVGTTSIEQNELLSSLLNRAGIDHELLNAKNHEREAEIIAAAGNRGAVTVATNMAGRGVDIILGGTPPNKYLLGNKSQYDKEAKEFKVKQAEIRELGGLFVIGTERHESRRIDNQLRGRSGRQGDPGTSIFFVSLEDEIMRLFGGEQIAGLMTRFNLPEDQPLTHPIVSKALEQAQIKVEGFHFDSRKHLVEYDDVLNKQREIIYSLRNKILEEAEDLKKLLLDRGFPEEAYKTKEKEVGKEVMPQLIRWVFLQVIDSYWMEHLTVLEDLRQGIGLRGYGQKDPLVEYKNEAYLLFERLVKNIDAEVQDKVLRVQVKMTEQEGSTRLQEAAAQASYQAAGAAAQLNRKVAKPAAVPSGQPKLGRNDLCWCGSGKKFKRCHYPNLA